MLSNFSAFYLTTIDPWAEAVETRGGLVWARSGQVWDDVSDLWLSFLAGSSCNLEV